MILVVLRLRGRVVAVATTKTMHEPHSHTGNFYLSTTFLHHVQDHFSHQSVTKTANLADFDNLDDLLLTS